MTRSLSFVLAVLVAGATTLTGQPAAKPLKIFISADMEGIAGVVQPAQLGPTGFEYGKARE